MYQSLVIEENLEISSTINVIEIRLLVENLAQMLGVPYVGFANYTYQTWSFVTGVDAATITRTLFDQPLPNAQIFPASILSAKNKLLHSLITKTLIPRIENKGDFLMMDQVLLWLLSDDNPISLP